MNYYWDDFIKEVQSSLRPDDVLLDAGAGDCHWKNYFPDAHYIGMDLGVGDSREDYSKLDICGDLRKIPLEDESVDVIICIQVLEHLAEPWNVLTELNRILKKGGKLFITCPQSAPQHQVPYDFFRYTPFGLRSLLESRKFDVVWIKPQRGNFYKIGHDFGGSARKIATLSEQPFKKMLLTILSVYFRSLWRIHKKGLEYFDQFDQFQDDTDGHFVLAKKTKG